MLLDPIVNTIFFSKEASSVTLLDDNFATIVAACRRHGVVPGIHGIDPAYSRARIAQCYQFVTCGVDADLIVAGAQGYLIALTLMPLFIIGSLILGTAQHTIDADIAQVWQSSAARSEALYQRRHGLKNGS